MAGEIVKIRKTADLVKDLRIGAQVRFAIRPHDLDLSRKKRRVEIRAQFRGQRLKLILGISDPLVEYGPFDIVDGNRIILFLRQVGDR